MKKIIILLAILLFLSLPQHAWAELSFEETKKLAEQGDTEAQYNLGRMYYSGEGVTQDYKQAFHWFQKPAEQGDTGAQFLLGFLYKNGLGVIESYEKAVHYYQKAAEKGFAGAQYELGLLHVIISHDYKKAYPLLIMAQANGADASEMIKQLKLVMTSEQIKRAQKRANKCYESDYKKCGDLFK